MLKCSLVGCFLVDMIGGAIIRQNRHLICWDSKSLVNQIKKLWLVDLDVCLLKNMSKWTLLGYDKGPPAAEGLWAKWVWDAFKSALKCIKNPISIESGHDYKTGTEISGRFPPTVVCAADPRHPVHSRLYFLLFHEATRSLCSSCARRCPESAFRLWFFFLAVSQASENTTEKLERHPDLLIMLKSFAWLPSCIQLQESVTRNHSNGSLNWEEMFDVLL